MFMSNASKPHIYRFKQVVRMLVNDLRYVKHENYRCTYGIKILGSKCTRLMLSLYLN